MELIIFDFDNCLKLHSANNNYRQEYEELLKIKLKEYSKKYILAIASQSIHQFTKQELINMEILQYFTKIIVNQDVSKTRMLTDLLQFFNKSALKTIFLDDDADNINEAKALDINTICVPCLRGINWKNLDDQLKCFKQCV